MQDLQYWSPKCKTLILLATMVQFTLYIMVKEIITNILLHAMQYSPIVILLRIEQFPRPLIGKPRCLSSLWNDKAFDKTHASSTPVLQWNMTDNLKLLSKLCFARTTSISSVSVRKEKGERLNERKIKLSDGTELREYYIVGDPGFPSLQWLVTPFQRDEISESDLDFNKKHFETWEVAPRALARLKEEWKFLQNVWKPDMDKLPRMILACCILHNIVIDMNGEMHHELSSLYEHDSGYQQERWIWQQTFNRS